MSKETKFPTRIPCFVDTQVFHQANFDPKSKIFRILRHLAYQKRIKLVFPRVTAIEIKKHLQKQVLMECNKLQAAMNNARALSLLPENLSKKYVDINIENTEEIQEAVAQAFKNFINELDAIELSCHSVNADDLLNDYSKSNPPFSENKPNEFKDAIAIHTLKNYLDWHSKFQKKYGLKSADTSPPDKELYPDSCIILSGDMDFHSAFKDDSRFTCYKNIVELATDYPDHTVTDIFNRICISHIDGRIIDAITSQLQAVPINVEGVSGSASLISCAVSIPPPIVLSLTDETAKESSTNKAELWWEIEAECIFDLTYELPGTGCYNPDTKQIESPEIYSEQVTKRQYTTVRGFAEAKLESGKYTHIQSEFKIVDFKKPITLRPQSLDMKLVYQIENGYTDYYEGTGHYTRYFIAEELLHEWRRIPFAARYLASKKLSDRFWNDNEDALSENDPIGAQLAALGSNHKIEYEIQPPVFQENNLYEFEIPSHANTGIGTDDNEMRSFLFYRITGFKYGDNPLVSIRDSV